MMRYKKITVKRLKQFGACREAIKEFEDKKIKSINSVTLLKKMYKQSDVYLKWANWLITRIMTRKQYLAYAIYAAEQVLDIYERKYTNDNRPRKAIKAARKVLKKDTFKNRRAAADAADAADAAYYAAAAAYYAAAAAYYAADAAADTADAAAAAAYATAAAVAEKTKIRKRILRYGIKLLEEE